VAARPFVGSIVRIAEGNRAFRRVLFTGEHLQLVVMSLEPGEEIGAEVHRTIDQFFRIEEGEALFVFGRGGRGGSRRARSGDAVVVPAGTVHNVRNPSRTTDLKLYTIYAPPQHPRGTVQRTKPRERRSRPGLRS